ncbi:MAG: hypothetical protein KDD70_15060 [Bdellovibrionales bacterium]|nr:hypothetical protein [Bdellovibrionales bacterium]
MKFTNHVASKLLSSIVAVIAYGVFFGFVQAQVPAPQCEACPEGEQTYTENLPFELIANVPELKEYECPDVEVGWEDTPGSSAKKWVCKKYEGDGDERKVTCKLEWDPTSRRFVRTPARCQRPRICGEPKPSRTPKDFATAGLGQRGADALEKAATEYLESKNVCHCDENACNRERSCELDDDSVTVNGPVDAVSTSWTKQKGCTMKLTVASIDYECDGACRKEENSLPTE